MTKRLQIIVGIDAIPLRAGGGITYLYGLLGQLTEDVDHVVVWGLRSVLHDLPSNDRVTYVPLDGLGDQRFGADWYAIKRPLWRFVFTARMARMHGCSLVYQPSGTLIPTWSRVPMVVISRNMLPFDPTAARVYGWGLQRVRLLALRWWQQWSFARASGVIVLTEFAREMVITSLARTPRRLAVIPHGIGPGFQPRRERDPGRVFTWLYVSTVDEYKHQREVSIAGRLLRERGIRAQIDFVGPARESTLTNLRRVMAECDPEGTMLAYRGAVPYRDLPAAYAAVDGFIFASSCENLPHILLEAMATRLPIACSSCRPMPDILGDGGTYFDPRDPVSIANAMERLIRDKAERRRCADTAFARSRTYTWERSAAATWRFLADVALTEHSE